MNMWWLILVTLNHDFTIDTELLTAFDYKPACQIAAEGRQIYKTADHIQYQQYVCVGEHEDDKI